MRIDNWFVILILSKLQLLTNRHFALCEIRQLVSYTDTLYVTVTAQL
jgi:hypothetical protein